MNAALETALRRADGVLAWPAARGDLPNHVLSYATRVGQVMMPFPGVLVHPEYAAEPQTRVRAALTCAGPDAALSHVSALAVWGVTEDNGGSVHVMTGNRRRVRVDGIVAHRRAGFRPEPPSVVHRNGLPVTCLERSLIDTWGALGVVPTDARRAPLLRAVGERMTTPARLATALGASPRLAGRAELAALLTRLDAGCRSELELWGYDHVFTGPGMPAFRWQVRIAMGRRVWYLDVLPEPTRTNFELDGAKWHAHRRQRERDLRRDAALATLGIHSVRFSHDRLIRVPEQVRREVLAIIAARARDIGRST